MKLGALDFLTKPYDIEKLFEVINKVFVEDQLKRKSKNHIEIIGSSDSIKNIFSQISKSAKTDITVLIHGESGTGKELVARSIHNQSNRSGQFIAINCGAIPENLLESQFFGHEKGAFTGADTKHIGFFEQADTGTLFLDEIAELTLGMQVKLLRMLQERSFYRVGGKKEISSDVRIVAATNKNLSELVLKNKFREDLYYRLNVLNIDIPPLRNRGEDVIELVEYFINKLSFQCLNRKIYFNDSSKQLLRDYNWPGNIRELENLIEKLLILSPEDKISLEYLNEHISLRNELNIIDFDIIEKGLSLEEAGKIFEKEVILSALEKSNNVQTKAAKLLGVSRRILKYKMDKLHILIS
ncbi:UNVERIFIED_CONTAM: hypothetical protein GTU68_000334 [Idotea baltica]|nr:hypothetical protein [Idotea baltica]